MAFFITDQVIGNQPIADTSTVKNHLIGTVVRAVDPIYGEGEFIYLNGVASTVAGDWVSYTTSAGVSNAGATTRWAGTANTGLPLAVAMSANVSGQYGWYQITGSAVANCSGAVSAGDDIFFAQTATVGATTVGGKQVLGATASSAHAVPTSNKAIFILSRPFVQGQIT